MSQTLTEAQQLQLQLAYNAMVAQMAQISGVLGMACVIITKDNQPQTIYAGEIEFLSPGIELLKTRLDEVEILTEISTLMDNVDAKVH